VPYPMPTDPEVLAYIDRTNSFYPADAFTFTVEQNRAWYDKYAAEMRKPHPPGLQVESFGIVTDTPRRKILARRYRMLGSERFPGVTVLYLHGGGFILGGLESHDDACAGLCSESSIEIVAIHYRLAPEHVHPAQGDDAEAAFLQLSASGRHVIVAGDSAGGNLAAALCLRRKAKGTPHPIGQLLIYPGLGGDATKGSYIENANAPMLTNKEGAYYFKIRTGGKSRDEVDDPDLMPLKAKDFSGLPPAYVVTADIDPIRDDGHTYVERLKASGVPAVWRNEPQLVHGYIRARHMSRRASDSMTWMAKSLASLASELAMNAGTR
jgi:acetyl esterase